MNKLTVAAMALAAIGLASTAASAQTVNPGPYDLVLGFQLAGNNTDLEVDLGPITTLNLTPGAVTNLSSDLSVSDLTSTYGTGWVTNSSTTGGVNWSVAGLNAVNDGASFYGTSTSTPSSVRTSSASGLSGAWGQILDLAQGSAGSGSLNGAPVASTSSSALIGGSVNAVNPGGTSAGNLSESYTSLEGGNGYSFLPSAEQTGVGTDTLFSFTPQNKVSNKYPLATDLGTFSLTDPNGPSGALSLTFTAASVPEPSAYALGICAVLLFLVLKRRHSVA
ncbi:MAG TPA: hypothetical protein VGZ93_06090 [Candidatus Methylacidiphilales bacterium]|nr:hypothetical protein [Candidatus Methylacidiphilales bacterium]